MFEAKVIKVDVDLLLHVHVNYVANVGELEEFRRQKDLIVLDGVV